MADLRPATHDDIDALVALAYAMHDESPRFRLYPFMADRMRETLATVLGMPLGFARVTEVDGVIVGAFVGVAAPHFACDVLQAQDLGVFVERAHRGTAVSGHLIKAFLAWADSIGAEANIGVNTGVMPERTERLLAAMGARQTGTNWTWGI